MNFQVILQHSCYRSSSHDITEAQNWYRHKRGFMFFTTFPTFSLFQLILSLIKIFKPFWRHGSSLSTWRNKCFQFKINISSFELGMNMSISGCRTLLQNFILEISLTSWRHIAFLQQTASTFSCFFPTLKWFHFLYLPWELVKTWYTWNSLGVRFLRHRCEINF